MEIIVRVSDQDDFVWPAVEIAINLTVSEETPSASIMSEAKMLLK